MTNKADSDKELSQSELGFRMVHFTQKRAHTPNAHVQKFYDLLLQMCTRESGTEAVITLLFDTNLTRENTSSDLIPEALDHLARHKELFDKRDDLKEAKSFINAILFPLISANPHIRVMPDTWKKINPDALYAVITHFQLEETFLMAPIPLDIRNGFLNRFEEPNTKSALQMATEKLNAAQEAGNPIAIEFYRYIAEEQQFVADSSKEPDHIRREKFDNRMKVKDPQFISWVLKNFVNFGDEERLLLKNWLEITCYFMDDKTRHDLSQAKPVDRRKILEDRVNGYRVVSHVTPITDLFHLTYLVGIQNQLHEGISGQLFPKEVLRAYREWKDTTAAVSFKKAYKEGRLDDVVTIINPKLSAIALEEKPNIEAPKKSANEMARDNARSSKVKTLYAIFVEYEKTVQTSYPNIRVLLQKFSDIDNRFVELISTHHDHFNEKEKSDIRSSLLSFLLIKDSDVLELETKKLLKQKLGMFKSPFALFKAVHLYGISNEFEKAFETNAVPTQVQRNYNEWKKTAKNQAFIAECATRNNPASVTIAEEAPAELPPIANDNPLPKVSDPRLTIIHVDHILVTDGNRADGAGISESDKTHVDQNFSRKSELEDLGKTEKLYSALLADPQSGIKHITVRLNAQRSDDDKKSMRPYNLIDIEMNDGTISRVVVCDFEYHTTYIEREAPSYQENHEIQIANLLKNPKVWTARHLTDTQWLERLQEVLYTPVADLTIEVKHRNRNGGLGEMLIHSFAKAVMVTGKLPAPKDRTPIWLGTTETTWSRMYHALNDKTIQGLEEYGTFNRLFNHLAVGENVPLPQLQKFQNKPTITADMIIKARDVYVQDMGEELSRDEYDLLTVDGLDTRLDKITMPDMRRNGNDVELALQFEAVAIPSDVLPEGASYPRNLNEFFRLVDESQSRASDVKLAIGS